MRSRSSDLTAGIPCCNGEREMSKEICPQDAHELLLDLLNDVSELLEAEHKRTGSVAGADHHSFRLCPLTGVCQCLSCRRDSD